jgi:hypothetical protein
MFYKQRVQVSYQGEALEEVGEVVVYREGVLHLFRLLCRVKENQ